MLFRFSLYGFLKNQRYFEPFLILAFLGKGLSFTEIGLLIGFREICINLMEVPSGALADLAGRRRCMIFSFLAYIGSFAIFAAAEDLWTLFAAMFLFSIGEAFRTGTHKAMIFQWLLREGRSAEKTKTYGLTRSWSKLGSAASVIIAAVLAFTLRDYSYLFALCIVPYLANIVNFLTYPSWLDGDRAGKVSPLSVLKLTFATLGQCVRLRPLRRLLSESMTYEGTHRATKDYVQPVVKAAAVGLPVLAALGDMQRTAVLVGAVYLALHLLGSYASRHAGSLVERAGSERQGARWLWAVNAAAFAMMAGGIAAGFSAAAIAAFVVLAVAQNFWRPIMVSRIADRAAPAQTATVLSVESQAKSLFAAALAPLIGLAVDWMSGISPGTRFLPIGVVGLSLSAWMLLRGSRAGAENAPAELTEPAGPGDDSPARRPGEGV